MKGIRFSCCSALLVLLALGNATAAGTVPRGDGNLLLRACRNHEQLIEKPESLRGAGEGFFAGYCHGLLSGILNFREVIFPYVENLGHEPVCFPENGIPVVQAEMVVLKYLRDHPEKLHLGAEILVIMALSEAFPCKQ